MIDSTPLPLIVETSHLDKGRSWKAKRFVSGYMFFSAVDRHFFEMNEGNYVSSVIMSENIDQ